MTYRIYTVSSFQAGYKYRKQKTHSPLIERPCETYKRHTEEFLHQENNWLKMFVTLIGVALLGAFVLWLLRKLTIGNYGDRYVFITGCDTGFGNMLTKRLDDLGLHVFASCLTESGVEEIRASCSDRVLPVSLDVTKDASIAEALEFVKRHLPKGKGLWALVNNAGILGSMGPHAWQGRKDYLDCLDVNLFGVISVTKAFMPLVAMEKGRVVITSSIAGRFAMYPVYSISKYGVEAFADSLRHEVHRQGVGVHILEPGHFATPIANGPLLLAMLAKKIDSLPPNIKSTVPDAKKDELLRNLDIAVSKVSKDTFLVVDAYIHAITARFPKYRYLVGNEAKVFFRLLWTLPECISDYIFIKYIKKM